MRSTIAQRVPTTGLVAAAIGLVAIMATVTLLNIRGTSNPTIRDLPIIGAVMQEQPPVFQSAILDLRVPMGIAVTPNGGRLYVSEGDGDRLIKEFDARTGELRGVIAAPGTTTADRKPMGLAVSRDGVLFAVDRLRMVVDIFDPDNNWLGVLPVPVGQGATWEPLGVAIGNDGEVYVTNANTVGAPFATYSTDWKSGLPFDDATTGIGGFQFPAGIGVSLDDRLVIADSNSGRVVLMGRDRTVRAVIGEGVGDEAIGIPRSPAVDSRSRMYVPDVTGHSVKVWDISDDEPRFLFDIGGPGIADGEFLYPNAVAVDDRGTIFVTDTGNDRVQKWLK